MNQFCPHCHARIPRADATFCSACGTRLAAGPAQPRVAAHRNGTIRLPDRPDLLTLAAFTIGRDATQNRLFLDHPSISRVHAKVERTAHGYVIQDLRSSNGTFVNNRALYGAHHLQRGDVVHIGPYKLVFDRDHFAQTVQSKGYRIDAQVLTRTVSGGIWPRQKKPILQGISLTVHPGEFVALVGGSGTGKSTLMKALSGFAPANGGRVLYNGDHLYDNFAAYRTLLGYVPQDDIIHTQLPVASALRYAARLRLPDASHTEIAQRIAKVLDQVDLTSEAATTVAQLSGGQRKRVSIAAELLADPTVFFLDEPTSGLDPGLEQKMMQTMRTLADGGRTVVLVTHATANIELCHQIAFLGRGGHLTYYGPPTAAKQFFGCREYAEIYNRIADAQESEQWAQRHARAQSAQPMQPSTPTPRGLTIARSPQVSPVKQFAVLVQRNLELIWRERINLAVLLLVMPIIGCFLLLMVNAQDLVGESRSAIRRDIQAEINTQQADEDPLVDDELFQASYTVAGAAQKILLMLALAANLLGVFAASYEIVKEGPIYQRERMVNLKIWPYLLSKLFVLGLFGALQSLLLLWVIGFGLEYPTQGVLLEPRLEMFITLFLATLASICLGLLISAAVNSRNAVIYIILLVLFLQILFAGALFKLERAEALSYFTTTRWTLEALGSTVNMAALDEMGVSCIEFETPLPGGTARHPCTADQTRLPVHFDFYIDYAPELSHLAQRWLILAGFALGFTVLTYAVQRNKDVV